MLLNAHTYYSYKFGTYKPATLMKQAKELGHKRICITDVNSTSAVIDCQRLSKKEIDIDVIPGIDVRNGAELLFVALPMNDAGFLEINNYVSSFIHDKKDIPKQAPQLENVFFIYPFQRAAQGEIDFAFKNHFVGVQGYELGRLKFSPLRQHEQKLIAMSTVTFENKRSFNAHRLLRAIDNNLLLSKLPKSEEDDPRHVLHSAEELKQQFAEFPNLVYQAEQLLERCEVQFEFKTNKNKKTYTDSKQHDMELLRSEAEKGLAYRYRNADEKIINRVNHELKIIDQMDFCSYFLINWDIVNYATSQGHFHVGRGSGANSIIAYLLRITDVDPIELDLYFERFINPHRASPPDFDIDFSWRDRQDITDYIFETFGRDRVALLGAYNTFKDRSVTRELGKVLGVPAAEIDELQKHGPNHNIGEYGNLMLKYGSLIEDFPSHLSIHSSGILISEEPIHAYTATFLPPKGFPTTHFDMITAEDIGLHKFDILSQRGLGKIKDAVSIIKQNRGEDVDVHDIPKFKNDPEIKTLLSEAKVIGCFYTESPAMRLLLTKLKAKDYISLVAASSIIRPGVAKSGMMREYIIRFRDHERRKKAREALPEMYDLLAETFGVMVYQEDVIRVAHLFANLSLGEADILRRGMSWRFKQRNEFNQVKEQFFTNCIAKGHSMEVIQKIWYEIESFANFAFAKGHSASYAVESFQTLYLKAYYPIEYMVATVNNGGGFYRSELYLREARMHGAAIEPPCVNTGERDCTVNGKTITLGLFMINEIEEATIHYLLKERENGLFQSLADFIDRVPIGIEQIDLLIRAEALRFIEKPKKELLWQARLLKNKMPKKPAQKAMFSPQPKAFKFPELHSTMLENAFDQIELFGFPLCDPFLLTKEPTEDGIKAADLKNNIGKQVKTYGYLVTSRRTYTAKGEMMYFGNFVDKDGQFIDSVHFPDVAKKFPFSGIGVYQIIGKVTVEFDCIQIEASELHRVPYIEDPRYAEEQTYKGTKDHSIGNFLR